jgi:hypothetical protein
VTPPLGRKQWPPVRRRRAPCGNGRRGVSASTNRSTMARSWRDKMPPSNRSNVGVATRSSRKSENAILTGGLSASTPRSCLSAAPRTLLQKTVQDQAEQNTEPAKHDKRPAPSVKLADEPSEENPGDGSDVDGGLVEAQGARPRSFAVVVADQRNGERGNRRSSPIPPQRARTATAGSCVPARAIHIMLHA